MKENNKYSVVLDEGVYKELMNIAKSSTFHNNELSDEAKISLVANKIMNESCRNYKINNLLF